MKSEADGWIVYEMQSRKKVVKQAIPHKLELFDSKEKLWARFQNLAFHYFHFKHREYIGSTDGLAMLALASVDSPGDKRLQRKDRCRDKNLFKWDADCEFAQLKSAPTPSKKSYKDELLRRRLVEYKLSHPDPKIRTACDVILQKIESIEALRFVPMGDDKERQALQIALRLKMGGDERSALEIIAEVKALLDKDMLL